MRYPKFSIWVLFFATLISCNKDDVGNNLTLGKPSLYKINPEKVYPFDIVTIYGENLGYFPDSGFILIDTFIVLRAKDCLKWNNSFIQFVAPKNFRNGKLFVVKAIDTSNGMDFNYFPYPKIDLVEIPAGVFLMGSKTGLGFEQPVHEVQISHNFLISKFEITQRQWLSIMDTNTSKFAGDYLPVMNVDWYDALKFCNRLSNLMGFDSCYIFLDSDTIIFKEDANGFRLPTEAEWEYACRAGTTGDFSGNGNPLDMGWFDVNSGMKPHPVGEKLPNAWGLYDMHGNAWEWCWDWFDPFYYEKSPRVNPLGPEKGKNRVVRGGCWQKGTTFGRSSARQFPEDQKTNFGFRIVRTLK